MRRIQLTRYLNLGWKLYDMQIHFSLGESEGDKKISRDAEFKKDLEELLEAIKGLNLNISEKLIASRIDNIPETEGEYKLLLECIYTELDDRVFIHVSAPKDELYENNKLFSEGAKKAFPTASAELRLAGNAYALGLPTASVYHCMRALESGLNALAYSLEVDPGVQNWQNVLDQIEAAIKTEGKRPSSPEKTSRLQFLSEAATEFRHFKDAWRNHVAHSRATYGEAQALTILNQVRSFFEVLARQLREPAT